MSMTFTDVDTGATIVIPNNGVQAAYQSEDFNVLELVGGQIQYVSDSWAYVLQQLQGGPPV